MKTKEIMERKESSVLYHGGSPVAAQLKGWFRVPESCLTEGFTKMGLILKVERVSGSP